MVVATLQYVYNSPRWQVGTLICFPPSTSKPCFNSGPSNVASFEKIFFEEKKRTWMWWCKNIVKRLWPQTIKCTHFFLYCLKGSKIILECLFWLSAQSSIWKELCRGSEQVTIENSRPKRLCPPPHFWLLTSSMLNLTAVLCFYRKC